MRLQLDGELVAVFEELLGVLGGANTGGSTGEDDSTGRQGGALGQEADELGHVEDQVTVQSCWSAFVLDTHYLNGKRGRHTSRGNPEGPFRSSIHECGTCWHREPGQRRRGRDLRKFIHQHEMQYHLYNRQTVPMGQEVSKPLEKHHWLWFIW